MTTPLANNKPSNRKRFSALSVVNSMLIGLLLIAVVFAAAPGYLEGGKWSWSELPGLENTRQMRSLLKTGVELKGWQTIQQKEIRLGGKKWSIQAVAQDSKNASAPALVLLAPQTYYKDRPYVEWTDIQGLEKWKTDSRQQLLFNTSDSQSSQIEARFFRAWNRQTFAVVQWYAFPDGGHSSSLNWFWRDLAAQLKGKRVPWIAVCLKIPLNPLDDLESVRDVATTLAQQIQTSLQQNTFYVSIEKNS